VTVGELKARVTYTEFLEWLEFLRWDEDRQTKIDVYLAQIAAEVRRGHVMEPKKVKVQDFLLLPREEAPKNNIERSKQTWAACLKINLN